MTPLWRPSKAVVKNSNLTRFMKFVNQKHAQQFQTYDQLYDWSVTEVPSFWAAVWEFCEIKASNGYSSVVDDAYKMPGATWFEGARLNFAENLLRYQDDQTALIFKGEDHDPVKISYAELYHRVAKLAGALRNLGVQKGDRVVGLMPNLIETVVAMLAATSLGAIWSSCSPDFGISGVLDRFKQIEPTVLFTADGYWFKGGRIDSLEKIKGIVPHLPTLRKVVVVSYLDDKPDVNEIPHAIRFSDFIADQTGDSIEFEQVPFEHPVYIMYSSGTTGLPKCMVQSVGGILLQHVKEHRLHTDLKREDTLFYFTTCGWMMWNWLVSSLATGATIVLYDGSPFYPDPGALWQLAQDENITVFGTSARYIAAVEKEKVKPECDYDLRNLRAILSTGSPLSVESFHYIYREVKTDVQLASISGGTDLNGCFALGNPLGPVYAGELQCRGLGMKVEAFNSEGNPVRNQKGELVCLAAFPSMPVYFWNDPDHKKYLKSYFEKYPHVWAHGDFIEITDRGGVIIYGRSDATLNPGGVRIGTAEIYRQVETLPEISDSLVIGQDWQNDVRVILFVKMADGYALTESLCEKIKATIRENTTPRHVPAKIIAVPDIPYTISLKKVELAVRNVIHGEPVLNQDALMNPHVLDFFKDLPTLKK